MRYGKLIMGVVAAMIMTVSASPVCAGTTYGEWEVYEGIGGVGEISKTAPTDYNNLHYNGGTGAETASFVIQTSGAYDCDRRNVYIDEIFDHYDYANAGLHSNSTVWICGGNGSMPDGAFTSVYTPASEVESGVNVKARVFDGLGYNTEDPYVEKQWYTTLNTFKVGVILKGTDDTPYDEDGAGTELLITELGSFACLHAKKETGFWEEPGIVMDEPAEWKKNIAWQAVARSASGNITGIQKRIRFQQKIIVSGSFEVSRASGGSHIPLTSSSITITLLGRANPYVAAAIAVTNILSNTCSACDAYVGGDSAIENMGVNEIDETMEHDHATLVWKTVNMAALSRTGSLIKLLPNSQRQGSVSMKTMAGGTDYGSLAWISTEVDPQGTQYVKFGVTKPTYGD